MFNKKTALAIVVAVAAVFALQGPVEAVEVSYKVGKGTKVKSEDGNNEVNISGRVQGRHTYTLRENSVADTNTFEVRRAKLSFKGHVLNPNLKFKLQGAFGTKSSTRTTSVGGTTVVTRESTSGLFDLEDAYADWTPLKWIGIRFGQFKVPFLKQELTSSGKQQFVDRALSTGDFTFKRDIGVSIHGHPWEHFRYDIFAMNGAGANTFNVNQGLLFGTRIEFPILGKYKSSESDVKWHEDPDLGVGIAYAFNEHDLGFSGGTVAAGTKTSHGTIDVGFKYKGFSLQAAAMMLRTHDAPKLTNLGYLMQVGYFIVPEIFEIAARGASTFFTNAVVNEHEYAMSLNWFIKGHPIKFQTDVAYLINNGGTLNQDDFRVRNQLQFVF